MARLESPYWDERLGVCEKHYLPSVPCPACLADRDEDVVVVLDELERGGWVLYDELAIPKGFENHNRR